MSGIRFTISPGTLTIQVAEKLREAVESGEFAEKIVEVVRREVRKAFPGWEFKEWYGIFKTPERGGYWMVVSEFPVGQADPDGHLKEVER